MSPTPALLRLTNLCEVVGRQNYNNSPSRVAIAFFDIPMKKPLDAKRQLAPSRDNGVLRKG
jgi:hypothetical protein